MASYACAVRLAYVPVPLLPEGRDVGFRSLQEGIDKAWECITTDVAPIGRRRLGERRRSRGYRGASRRWTASLLSPTQCECYVEEQKKSFYVQR